MPFKKLSKAKLTTLIRSTAPDPEQNETVIFVTIELMNLLLLPGNSLNNKGWAYEARGALAPLFDRCVVHEYTHWTSGAAIADIDLEIEALRQATKGLD